MATLNQSLFDKLYEDEGRQYECVKDDKGGETKFGITWDAVAVAVDGKILSPDVLKDKDYIKYLDEADANEIHKYCTWILLQLDKLVCQSVANKFFNMAVLLGNKQATKCMQRACRANGNASINDDGIIGPDTIKAINASFSASLIPAFRSECAGIFRVIVANNPEQKKFLGGWLTRAYF